MRNTTDPQIRAQFITGLRALADYLAAHPAIPVPLYGDGISIQADSTENGGNSQVDRIARLLGVKVIDDTPTGGHYYATRSFGPVSYEVVSIPELCMAKYEALMSYQKCVIPDGTQNSEL